MSSKLCVSGAAGGGGTDESAQPKQEPHTKMWGTIQGKILVLLIYPICFLEITQHVARSYMEPIKYVAHFKETPSLSASQQEPKGEFSLNCPC